MNPELIISAVGGVLDLIQTVLPLIKKGSAGSSQMGTVVDTLIKIEPLAVDQVGTVYTGVKNIIEAVGTHPASTADQLVALKAFDKKMDDAWDAIETQIDPDAAG